MSPEISTTVPTPLGICTRSLSLGLQTSMELFLTVRGNAPTCLTDLRNELKPPRGGFVMILHLSRRWAAYRLCHCLRPWIRQDPDSSLCSLQNRKLPLRGYQKRLSYPHALEQLLRNLIPGTLEQVFLYCRLKMPDCQSIWLGLSDGEIPPGDRQVMERRKDPPQRHRGLRDWPWTCHGEKTAICR